jgi:hypothetical protein
MKRLSALFLLLFATASPAMARVISYAPYTNRIAETAFHDRASRFFILLEAGAESSPWEPAVRQVVLYDTAQGGEEPRVIFPQNGSFAQILGAALFEGPGRGTPGPAPAPVIFVSTFADGIRSYVSSDGGSTWREVEKLRNLSVGFSAYNLDFGGPWVGGLSAQIQIGNSQWPFVVATNAGVWAVAENGNAKVIDPEGRAVIGRDATGTRFLTQHTVLDNVRMRYNYTTRVADVTTGQYTTIGTEWTGNAEYVGWIAPDGSAFILTTRTNGRFLYRVRNDVPSFIAGRRGSPESGLKSDPPGPPSDPNEFIAIPTHDYNGAWMIQRGAGAPTTLLHHTLQQGTREMWSDITAPEVEALIAGKSGETVLIQVHRDRSDAQQIVFIDPALAVWRVGQPAPREYDELYLNEEFNKGFVHVDVDTVGAGAPFVFSSGTRQLIDEGPISPAPGGGDVIQEWGVVGASLKQKLILPGVARLQGAFESQWRTDVTFYNPYDEPQQVEVRFVSLGEVTTSVVRTVTLTLKAQEVRLVADALHALFAIESGGGAMHFLPAKSISVTGRTYSRKGEGTFGFSMLAIDAWNAAGPRFPLSFAGAFPGEHFRTNMLITDTSGRGITANINAYGVAGRIGSSNEPVLTAPPNGVMQYNNVGGSLGLLNRDAGGMVVQPLTGTGIAMVAAIDNRTNDPTYFPPDLSVRGVIRTIPAIGHLPGANGSQFRSDVYLYNPSSQAHMVTLEAKKWDGPDRVLRQFTLLPQEARVIPDVLKSLFGMEGMARLRYWTNDQTNDGVRATSRTYTVEASGATYGSLVPPLNNFQVAAPGDTLEILGAASGAGFRTNIGLVELGAAGGMAIPPPTNVRIRIIDDQHRQLDSFTMTLQNGSGVQINDVFGARLIAPPAAARIVVEVLDGGLIGAYGSLTDNVTNDTTYCAAQLGAQ